MITSGKKAMLPSERSKVWKVVTSVEHYTWRSDLRGTEILCENQFLEYPKRGPVTAFTITTVEPCNRWEFDMENTNMRGHWTGLFTRRWQDRGKGAGIVLRHKESLLLKISNPVYAAGEKLCAWQSRKISPDATLCHFGQTLQETDGNGDYGFGQTMPG